MKEVTSGYAGGTKETADYRTVCTGTTDHAEAIKITYDASVITYAQLLQIFFTAHDPTTLDRQGNDAGHQYRSAIFYQNDDEKNVAGAYIKLLNDSKAFESPVVTTLEPLNGFLPGRGLPPGLRRPQPEPVLRAGLRAAEDGEGPQGVQGVVEDGRGREEMSGEDWRMQM